MCTESRSVLYTIMLLSKIKIMKNLFTTHGHYLTLTPYHIFEPLPWQQFLTLPSGSSDHWAQLLSSHGCRRRRRRHCLNLSQPRRLKPRRTLFLCQKVKKCYLFWKVIVFNQVSQKFRQMTTMSALKWGVFTVSW